MANDLENWMPMSPGMGPPLPKFLQVFWPWYKEEEEPPPAGLYGCPYCDRSFETLHDLIDHVAEAHPDQPPIGEIDIQWE